VRRAAIVGAGLLVVFVLNAALALGAEVPEITGLSPSKGPPGTEVTITGKGFCWGQPCYHSVTSAVSATFGKQEYTLQFQEITNTTIKIVRAPAYRPGSSVQVIVKTPAGESAQTSESAFTYTNWKGEYYALGDSFSSGLGAEEYGVEGNYECYRSYKGWPEIVAKSYKPTSFHFWACQGAELQSFYEEEYLGEAPQLNELAIPPGEALGPTLLTFSVGGNNANFGGIIKHCYYTPPLIFEEELNKKCFEYGNEALYKGVSELRYGREGNGKGLAWTIEEVHKRAPNASIRVVGYPQLFTVPTASYCAIGQTAPIRITKPEVEAFNAWTENLNAAIANITATTPAAQYVSTWTAFGKENVCTPHHRDVNLVTVTVTGEPEKQSVHPTAIGYKAMARFVTKSLKKSG
jgi:GDSL-like Lipase/Acylhydrolase family/IPT/TIG domain